MYSNSKHRDIERLLHDIFVYKNRIVQYQETIASLRQSLKNLQQTLLNNKNRYELKIAEKDAIIKKLSNQVSHLQALAQRDSTNTGLSTAATPINKKKHIPNSRRGSDKPKGAQKGHQRHTMQDIEPHEPTEIIHHNLDIKQQRCNSCGGHLLDTAEHVIKDEFDVSIKVVKRRHQYGICKCHTCGKSQRLEIAKNYKEKNQYGSNIQALALSLMMTGNVAINKVKMLTNAMSGGLLRLSEGFICSLYKRASLKLDQFMLELKQQLIGRKLLYWDDTVVMINKSRGCMRFYGDERIAYFAAHSKKDLNGIIADDILIPLTSQTTVMHDHNKVNYNDMFNFENIECIAHLNRDLQKVIDDNPTHSWAIKLKELIAETIKERKALIEQKHRSFTKKVVRQFDKDAKEYIKQGYAESKISSNPNTTPSENTLLKRLEKHYENYFLWVRNFEMPTTDNLSERGLRSIKSHMKISGQFQSEESASHYARIKSYTETCRKNGINEMFALGQLCAGKPVSVAEIFA